MFNIFNSKRHSLNKRDRELEPPTKKLISEGDVLIKKLSEKQLEKSTTLQEQLNETKEFVNSVEYIPVTNRISGIITTQCFQKESHRLDVIDKYKLLGLSEKDIELLQDMNQGLEYVKGKYKSINEDILLDNIQRVNKLLQTSGDCTHYSGDSNLPRQDHEAALSVKPDSTETKLLKFALKNEEKKVKLPHPMDNICTLEQNFMDNVDLFTPVDIKKIRKKARSLARAMNETGELQNTNDDTKNSKKPVDNSKWDVTESDDNFKEKIQIVSKGVRTCKPQKLYTIRDGKIVELKSDISQSSHSNSEIKQLSIDEIKNIPRFNDYDPGEKSNKLYLKNLHKNCDETDLRNLLPNTDNIVSIQLLKGKLKGQAFIQFSDESSAEMALKSLLGVVLKNKPIIVQYGKIKDK